MKARTLGLVLLIGLSPRLAAQAPAIKPNADTSLPESGDQRLLASPPAVDPAPQAIDPEAVPDRLGPVAAPSAEDEPASAPLERFKNVFGNFGRDPGAYSIVSVSRGLSTHKPMYLLPYSYSPDYRGAQSETVFTISAKQDLFGSGFYFGYTQKSFWQVYDGDASRPFRETNYNPELFYRWTPDPTRFHHWGLDAGFEHESNGEELPLSRSWNRLYIAPFRAEGRTLLYTKFWYRLPEDDKEDPLDPKGDDNPDIQDYYGRAEFHAQRQLGNGQLLSLMVRGNLGEGHGAFNLNYTIPSRDGYLFWQAYLWHGYGEGLGDYNDSVTRVGLGLALTR